MKVLTQCPHCGRFIVVEVKLRKGRGASYRVRKLSRLHVEILRVLDGVEMPLTQRDILRALRRRGWRVSGNSVSGRLSELLALGYVEVDRVEVRVDDNGVPKFQKKPVWSITPAGSHALLQALNR